MRALRATIAAIAVTMTGAAVAGAVGVPVPVSVSSPWATVNVCDTSAHPNAVGVRGSMPGTGRQRTHLYLRVQLQFRRTGTSWASLGRSGDSGWIDAGRTKVRARQAGRTFTITPPAKGEDAYVLRGRVSFEWRRGSRVLKRAQVLTTSGHRGVAGGDPRGFSAATCSIA